VPPASAVSSRLRSAAISVASLAARVGPSDAAMPPPALAISRYGLPAARMPNSLARSPAKIAWVWQSIRPGVTKPAGVDPRSGAAARRRSRPSGSPRPTATAP
jgi:hypothetical protein